MKKRVLAVILIIVLLFASTGECFAAPGARTVRIFFTHDIHSYLDNAAKAKTVIDKKSMEFSGGPNCFYFDAGDFSQGTLYQSGYETQAFELGILSALGCDATTPGNHEWDHAGIGFATMLNSAMHNFAPWPSMLCANLDFSGSLTEEQAIVQQYLDMLNANTVSGNTEYAIFTSDNGLKLGVFGVSGDGSIEDAPTSGMKWENYIDAAKRVVAEIKDECDIIICLSHSGTDGNGNGQDIELAKAVPDIDFIVSGHSHSIYNEPCMVGNTLIGSTLEYFQNIGMVDIAVDNLGNVSFENYKIIPLDETVTDDPIVKQRLTLYQEYIAGTYLAPYNYTQDEIISYSNIDFMPLDEMYATHQEYPMGNLIADSYIYEAEKNGIRDIDVALVGLGTIRGAFEKGPISVEDAFEICSLGVGADGSAGHPILGAYITGKELKLLVELDASLGPMVSSIKMSYSGLRYKFNDKRMLLDRVTELYLVDKDGNKTEIEDDKLYKVSCNMYAANMLGMLNGLTKGILKITPKYADGTMVDDFYKCALKDINGNDIKEWYAFADYINSFEAGASGYPEIPGYYQDFLGRKDKVSIGGLAVISNPGLTTCAVGVLIILAVLLLIALVRFISKRIKK